MSKKITMFSTLVVVALLATTVYAEVQNVKVGGDIDIKGVYANNYDLIKKGDYQSNAFYITTTRVSVEADLTDNVAATIRLINDRVWDEDGSASTDIDLDLGYITLKEMLYSPMTLTLGRQNLRFGNALVVGDPNTNAEAGGDSNLDTTIAENLSARKSFDAIRATFDYAPWTVDLIAAKIDEVDQAGTPTAGAEDEDLYGINVAYLFEDYNAQLEGYLFYKDDDADAETIPVGTSTDPMLGINGDIYTLGINGAMEPVVGLSLAGELALQFGDYTTAAGASRDQEAWALDLDATYAFENEYSPVLGIGYTYRSGEEQADSGDYEGWDPMYEDQTNGVIADYLLAGVNGGVTSNASIIRVYGSLKPIEAVTLSANYYNYRLDEKLVATDGTTVNYGGPIGSFSMNAKKDLGDEIDLSLTYDYTEDVQFGLTAAWFFPGDAFNDTNDDEATSVLGSVKVTF